MFLLQRVGGEVIVEWEDNLEWRYLQHADTVLQSIRICYVPFEKLFVMIVNSIPQEEAECKYAEIQ